MSGFNSTIKGKFGVCGDCTDGKQRKLIGGKCNFHYWASKSKLKTATKTKVFKTKPAAKQKPIKKASVKRSKENREYSRVRKTFLEQNPMCAVYPELFATQVHHKKGRIGKLLTDVRFFLAVSDDGHKKIESEPEWAKEQGFSISRLNKTAKN